MICDISSSLPLASVPSYLGLKSSNLHVAFLTFLLVFYSFIPAYLVLFAAQMRTSSLFGQCH